MVSPSIPKVEKFRGSVGESSFSLHDVRVVFASQLQPISIIVLYCKENYNYPGIQVLLQRSIGCCEECWNC